MTKQQFCGKTNYNCLSFYYFDDSIHFEFHIPKQNTIRSISIYNNTIADM